MLLTKMRFLTLISLLLLSFESAAVIETRQINSEIGKLNVETLAKDLGVPWGLSFLSSEQVLVTDRNQRLLRVDLKSGTSKVIAGLPEIYVSGQGGLLDVAVSEDFNTSKEIYFTYSVSVKGGSTLRLSRAKLRGDKLRNLKVLFTAKPASSKRVHYGSRIAFDGKGHLFFGMGDRGSRDNSQDLSKHNGKIFRLNLDGSVPDDNPFVKAKGALPEIWSYGHRNPQGLTFQGDTGRLWSHEHGPKGGDEINIVAPNKNYGWPVITYGREYWGPKIGTKTKAGMEQPIKHYVPSIAPSGMVFYSGKRIPEWKGDLFIGALALAHVNRTKVKGSELVGEERLLEDWGERIRNIGEGPDGYLYFTSDHGKLMRFRK